MTGVGLGKVTVCVSSGSLQGQGCANKASKAPQGLCTLRYDKGVIPVLIMGITDRRHPWCAGQAQHGCRFGVDTQRAESCIAGLTQRMPPASWRRTSMYRK